MTRHRTAAAGLLACLAPACEAPPFDSDFVRTDSAGVPILESFRPVWQDGNGWSVSAEPELAIGAGPMGGDDPNHPPWGFIRDVRVLSGGSLVVGDITTSEVTAFDSLGRLTHRFGGRGDGPGELEDFGAVRTCAGDTIIAGDPYAFNFFDSEGRFIRRLATVDGRTGETLDIFLTSADCRRFLIADNRRWWARAPEGPEGLAYWDLVWMDDSFVERDPVARVPATHIHHDGVFTLFVPWTAYVRPVPLAGDTLVFGYSQRAELRVVAPGGELKRIVRWHAPPDPVTSEDRRRWNLDRLAGEGGDPDRLGGFPWLPDHKAFFDKLKVDDAGNIWARALPPPDPSPERWTVLSAAGRWLGAVRMPDGFTLSEVARGRAYGVHRDELGVATARVYRLAPYPTQAPRAGFATNITSRCGGPPRRGS